VFGILQKSDRALGSGNKRIGRSENDGVDDSMEGEILAG
jgi:hypothetical protein